MPKDPPQIQTTPANSPYAPLTLDIEKYRRRLDGHGLSDQQKDEYLTALWLLIVGFADLKMPDLFQNTCGQPAEHADAIPDACADVLHSKPIQTTNDFDAAANITSAPKPSQEAS